MSAIECQVSAIRIYPLKSGGALELESARITPAGVETLDGKVKDHGLLLVRGEPDQQGTHDFITQRDKRNPNDRKEKPQSFAELALIRPRIEDGRLILSWNNDQVIVPEDDCPEIIIPVRVWEYEGRGLEIPLLSDWASDHLQYSVRVVATRGPWNRQSRQNYLRNWNPLRAQDGYPVHAVLLEDVLAMSEQAGQEIPWSRFRPQVLLEGMPAWSLHDIFAFELAGIPILQPKPCERCETTQVDQITGQISSLKPLKYLNRIRPGGWINQEGQRKQIVGENWLPLASGAVNIGDKVVVLATRAPVVPR